MKAILFKSILTSILFIAGFSQLFSQTNPYPEGLHIYPYLQYVTPSSIIIKWETTEPTIGTAFFSEDDSFSAQKSESSPSKIHEIKLEGLRPATKYQYRVAYDEIQLEKASFTTAPVPGTRHWRMVAYGDNRTYPETHKRIADQIIKLDPGIIIHSGDLVADGASYEQWKVQYFDPMKGLAENITVFPSLGNHERNSPHYYEYMSVPDENGESYYSFDYGNAHIIALNSNEREAPFEIDSEQTEWLIKDLKEHASAEWKIVYFHHPLFRCHPRRGIEPQRWVWQEIFDELDVDLVVNGHDHYYMRSYAIGNYKGEPSRGIYHLISGGGGAPNYPIIPKVHAANRRSVHHITVLDFQGDRIVGRAIDDTGNIFDAFVYDKEAENAPEEFISYEIFEIERDLNDAIINLPITGYEKDISINQTLEIQNPFSHPLQMTYSWEPSHNWVTNHTKVKIIQPGQPIKITYSVSSDHKNIYPLPSAKLHFQTPEGKMAFKNSTISFSPVKIGKKKSVKPIALKTTPVVDGDLSDVKWKKKLILDQFNDVQGGIPLQKMALYVSRNKNKNALYVAGKIESSPEASNVRDLERDHRYIMYRENMKVLIAVDEIVYTYAVSPKGALLDARESTTTTNTNAQEWNSTATASAMQNANGWQFEIEIPLDELNIKGKNAKINFVRRDVENNTECEYVLTYGKSGLDHRIPMYTLNRHATNLFAELIL
jgi:3',5'-cyclic AMP phosphodiesterase CpdA